MSIDSSQTDRRTLLQNALVAVEKMQSKLDAYEQSRREPIAIIGMSCRFPGGANTPEAYWNLLHNGVDAVTEIPSTRQNLQEYIKSATNSADGNTTWYGGFVDGIDRFDPHFFGLAPREVMLMDPQQRLVLEVSWEALERAGQAPDKLRGSQTGIFIGITTNDYAQLMLSGDPSQLDAYTATGGALNVTPGRVSYTLGFQGPSMAIDTACSSSLVAIHLACQSLRNGECHLALAGGVNVLLKPEAFVCFNRWGMMSSDGRCKTFDANADGFVRGEGCGIVVLKRLSDAIANGDNILALIRGSAVNQDGRSSGLTVPNGLAQTAVIRKALVNAGVRPSDVSYVETHGTGTSLGDPIEVEALGAALGEGRAQDQHLFLSSVKTNIGHLESAAGIAGLIKVVMAMQYKEIPPLLHLQERSPRIPWPTFSTIIPTEPTPWTTHSSHRFAGVSSFGFSGTNAHIVLEEAPVPELIQAENERPLHILTLSAKSNLALEQIAAGFEQHLTTHTSESLADVAFTANTGRAQFPFRLAVVAESNEQAAGQLKALAAHQEAAGGTIGQIQEGDQHKIVFLFAGQGSQYTGMGRQLYETEPIFRQAMDTCDELLRPYLNRSILQIIYPENPETSESSLLDQTIYTQPALFALEYSLAQVWQSWGITPSAVMGHSVGEYVAACIAGVFSLEDGLRLIAERGRLMQTLPQGGKMAAVFSDPSKVHEAIKPYADQVSIAAINGPQDIVISGAGGAMDTILKSLSREGISSKYLTVSHAFHSPLMEPILAEFLHIASSIAYHPPQVDLISNVSGQLVGEEIASPDYWQQHICKPVLFTDSIQTLHRQGYHIFLEIGPKPTLLSMGQRCIADTESSAQWLPSLRPGREDWQQLLHSLAALYIHGMDIDWVGFEQSRVKSRRRLDLPTYPFQRDEHWFKAKKRQASHQGGYGSGSHPLLGTRLVLAHSPQTYIWQAEIESGRLPYLKDHRVQGMAVLPATAYVEMVLAAGKEIFGLGPLSISEITNEAMLILQDDSVYTVQVVLNKYADNEANYEIYSQPGNLHSVDQENTSWVLHSKGKLHFYQDQKVSPTLGKFNLEEIQTRCSEEISGHKFYEHLDEKGNNWGPAFQGLERVWRGQGEALSSVTIPQDVSKDFSQYQFHPATSDACGHVLTATISMEKSDDVKGGAFVGGGIDEIRFYRRPYGERLWSYARLRPETEENSNVLIGDVWVYSETGELISETLGAKLWYLDHAHRQTILKNLDDWFYELRWQPIEYSATQVLPPRTSAPWLIFADSGGFGNALASTLRSRGEKCILVSAGETYDQSREESFRINPADSADMRRLLETTFSTGTNAIRGVVYLWGLDANLSEDEIGLQSLMSAQTLTGVGALHLVQELLRVPWIEKPRLRFITRDAQSVEVDSTPTAVAQAILWGFGRTLALEHAEIWGGLIDLDVSTSADEVAALLLGESGVPKEEDQLAFRRGQLYAARLVRASQVFKETLQFRCRSDGSYLITGGLGGIGLEVARWLIQRGARRLILLGRTELPARVNWQDFESDSHLGKKISVIRELESLGAGIHLAAVDVGDELQLQAFLENFQAEGWPAIRGVVHAAGIMQYQPMIEHEATAMHGVLRPKASGGWLLHQLLQDSPLDFFIMFSSNSALLSSPMMSSYAAANTFLDALAHYRKALGKPALSINWGTWGETGMVNEFNDQRRPVQLRGVGTISTRQGLEALERLIQHDAAEVAVMPIDWKEWQTSYPVFRDIPLFSLLMRESLETQPIEEETQSLSTEILRSEEPKTRRELLESYLSNQVCRILGLTRENLDFQHPLTNMGLDSLMAVELKNRIENDLGVAMPMVEFLQGPGLAQLTTLVLEKLPTGKSSLAGNQVGESAVSMALTESDWEEGGL